MSLQAPRRVDRHPSRVGGDQEISPRVDPVVWGGGSGPLKADQLETYARDGFVVVPDLLDTDTVTAAREHVDALAADPAERDSERAIIEPDSGELRSLFAVHDQPGALAVLARDPRLTGIAQQILGSDVYLHQTRINLKRGVGGKQFPWHSDFETWHVEDGMGDMRAVSASVVLTENRAWNGPLLLIAGSHHWYLSFPGWTPEDNHRTSLRRQTYGVPSEAELTWLMDQGRMEVFTGEPGSVVFFDSNVMHASPDNITPRPRTNAFFCYNSVDNALGEPFGPAERRPTHIAARDFTPV